MLVLEDSLKQHSVSLSKWVEVGVCVKGGDVGFGYYQNFLSLVSSHLIQRAHSGEQTLESHFVYG